MWTERMARVLRVRVHEKAVCWRQWSFDSIQILVLKCFITAIFPCLIKDYTVLLLNLYTVLLFHILFISFIVILTHSCLPVFVVKSYFMSVFKLIFTANSEQEVQHPHQDKDREFSE